MYMISRAKNISGDCDDQCQDQGTPDLACLMVHTFSYTIDQVDLVQRRLAVVTLGGGVSVSGSVQSD